MVQAYRRFPFAVKKAPRVGAVIMRPWVANLSPEWFAEHNPDWRENGLNAAAGAAYNVMLAQMVAEAGGPQNIVVASVHLDESLPQWQVAFTPVTDDGRLTQKPWFPSPGALRAMGQRVRQAVADTGIEVNFKPSERSREHLSGDEFQRQADMRKAELEAAKEEREAADQELTVAQALSSQVSKREAAANQRFADVTALVQQWETVEAPRRRKLVEDEARKDMAGDLAAATADRQKTAQELERTITARKAAEAAQKGLEGVQDRAETWIAKLEAQGVGTTPEGAYDLAAKVALDTLRSLDAGLYHSEVKRALDAKRPSLRTLSPAERQAKAARQRANRAKVIDEADQYDLDRTDNGRER